MKQNGETVKRTFSLPAELLDKLDKYSEETGISKTFVVKKALEKYLDEKTSGDGDKTE